MKNYLFIVLSLLIFVSCDKTNKSENDSKTKQEFDPSNYSDAQLDSMAKASPDSAVFFMMYYRSKRLTK